MDLKLSFVAITFASEMFFYQTRAQIHQVPGVIPVHLKCSSTIWFKLFQNV